VATISESMTRWQLFTRLLALLLYGAITGSIYLSSSLAFVPVAIWPMVIVIILAVGVTGLWAGSRGLAWIGFAATLSLVVLDLALRPPSGDEIMIVLALLQLVLLLAVIRLGDLSFQQRRMSWPIVKPIIAGTHRQTSYDLAVRSVKRNLGKLAVTAGGAYFVSILVLTLARGVAGSLLPPFDVALYMLVLVTTLVIMLVYERKQS